MPPAGKKFCWNCGAQLQPTARFCPMCGAQLPEAPVPASATEPAPAPTPDPVPTWEPQPTGQQPLTFVRDDHASRTGAPVSAPEAAPAPEPVVYEPVPAPDPVVYEPVAVDASLCCPNCRGRDLIPITDNTQNVDVEHKGYSASKGCCGWILLGPFGLLCGLCGQSDKTTVTNTSRSYWVCRSCGNKFRNLVEWGEELDRREAAADKSKRSAIVIFGLGIAYVVLTVLFLMIGEEDMAGLLLFMTLFILIFAVVLVLSWRGVRDKLAEERAQYEDLCRRAH